MIGRTITVAFFFLIMFSAGIVFSSEEREPSSEIFLYAGVLTGDTFVLRPPGFFDDVKLVFDDDFTAGFRYAYHFKPHVAAEFGFGFSPSSIFTSAIVSGGSIVTSAINANTYIVHANLVIQILRGNVIPYVTAGVGAVHLHLETAQLGFLIPSETDFAWNAGGGIKFHVKNDYFLRFDGRMYQTNPEFAENQSSTFGEITGGVSVLFNF